MSSEPSGQTVYAGPGRAALLCPGLYQYLKGEKLEGVVMFVLAAVSATASPAARIEARVVASPR